MKLLGIELPIIPGTKPTKVIETLSWQPAVQRLRDYPSRGRPLQTQLGVRGMWRLRRCGSRGLLPSLLASLCVAGFLELSAVRTEESDRNIDEESVERYDGGRRNLILGTQKVRAVKDLVHASLSCMPCLTFACLIPRFHARCPLMLSCLPAWIAGAATSRSSSISGKPACCWEQGRGGHFQCRKGPSRSGSGGGCLRCSHNRI